MNKYIVSFQKIECYQAEVMAESEDEAIKITQNISHNVAKDQAPDYSECDYFEIHDVL